jgi:hypothetical protein
MKNLSTKGLKQLKQHILIRYPEVILSDDVGLREHGEITILQFELDELCEERQHLIDSAHGNGTCKGANYGNEAKYEIKYRYSFTNPPAQERLQCFTMLTGSCHPVIVVEVSITLEPMEF